jgi:hypothetical protein
MDLSQDQDIATANEIALLLCNPILCRTHLFNGQSGVLHKRSVSWGII